MPTLDINNDCIITESKTISLKDFKGCEFDFESELKIYRKNNSTIVLTVREKDMDFVEAMMTYSRLL